MSERLTIEQASDYDDDDEALLDSDRRRLGIYLTIPSLITPLDMGDVYHVARVVILQREQAVGHGLQHA